MRTFVYLLFLFAVGCEQPPTNRQIKIELQTCIEPTLLIATGQSYDQCRSEIGVASQSELSGCFIWQDETTLEHIELFWAEGWRSTQSLNTQLSPTTQTDPLAVFFMGTGELDCSTLDRTTPCNIEKGCLLKLIDGEFIPGEQSAYTFSHALTGCNITSDIIDSYAACIDCAEESCMEDTCEDESVKPCDTDCGLGEQLCENGVWTACIGPEPQPELCLNEIDDDCDQQVDEHCETCVIQPLNDDTYFTMLSAPHQSVPLITDGTTSWLAWYADADPGSTIRNGYIRGFSLEQNALELTNLHQLPISQINDLVMLDGGVLVQVGIVNQRDVHVNYNNQSGTRDTTVFEREDTVWDATVTGTAFEQQIIYRTNALFLKQIRRADPRPEIPPLRLSTKVDHLGHVVVQGGDRTSIFYQDNTGAFPQGRVLSLIQVSSDGQTVIREQALLNPSTQTPIFVLGAPTVVFSSNQYLVVYSHFEDGRYSLSSLLINLDGMIVSAPYHIKSFDQGVIPQGLDLTSNAQERSLAWFESDSAARNDETRIQYLRLNQKGQPTSGVKTISEGMLRLFPRTQFDALGRLIVTWVQTDPEPGASANGLSTSLRAAVYEQLSPCN